MVQTPTRNLLIDAGTSQCFGSSLGYVLENLKFIRYNLKRLIRFNYPCASRSFMWNHIESGKYCIRMQKFYIAKADVDYWTSVTQEAQANDFFKPIFKIVRDA